ncbi:hypothetical protein LTR86_010508 [Recurvomyces mirabilis]|nr:hypothetical protein LTR86_010508 [Recurvomyces mirabilis]
MVKFAEQLRNEKILLSGSKVDAHINIDRTTHHAASSPLLGLPTEIRLSVYKYLLPEPQDDTIYVRHRRSTNSNPERKIPAIARTCRELRRETLPYHYRGTIDFWLGEWDDCNYARKWLIANLVSQASLLLKRIRICVGCVATNGYGVDPTSRSLTIMIDFDKIGQPYGISTNLQSWGGRSLYEPRDFDLKLWIKVQLDRPVHARKVEHQGVLRLQLERLLRELFKKGES